MRKDRTAEKIKLVLGELSRSGIMSFASPQRYTPHFSSQKKGNQKAVLCPQRWGKGDIKPKCLEGYWGEKWGPQRGARAPWVRHNLNFSDLYQRWALREWLAWRECHPAWARIDDLNDLLQWPACPHHMDRMDPIGAHSARVGGFGPLKGGIGTDGGVFWGTLVALKLEVHW